MKKLIFLIFSLFSTLSIFATDQISLINDENGYSYLKINEDINAFGFESDFKSVGNSGKVGIFKYPNGLEGQALKDYIAEYDKNDAKFSKHENNGIISFGNVSQHDRYGFYLVRNNGDIIWEWDWEYDHGDWYIGFDKNNHGKDEWIKVGQFYGHRPDPNGAPLPGSFAILCIGGIACVWVQRRK